MTEMLDRRPRILMHLCCAAAVLLGIFSARARAAPVTGWVVVNASTGGATTVPLTGAATSSPTIGNGTNGSATQVALFADIIGGRDGAADISLASGEQIILTGSATLSGISSVMEQFRFGLFYEPAAPFDAKGWLGYVANNSAGGSGGALRAKNADYSDFANNVFISTNASGSAANLQTAVDGDSFLSGVYDFSITVSRFGEELIIDAELSNGNGFAQAWRNAKVMSPSLRTFNFNRVGFLAGNGMSADKIEFHDISVTSGPIETLTLQVVAAGPGAGSARLVNKSGRTLSLEYYEIQSQLGSLASASLLGLSAQGGSFPANGWLPAGGNNAFTISEANLNSATQVMPHTPIQLGTIVAAASRDLQFYVGIAGDEHLRRAIVEYVVPGDFNANGVVDGADLAVWKSSFGIDGQGDSNGDNVTDGGDFLIWQRSATFGRPPASVTPEPGSALLAAIAFAVGLGLSRRCCALQSQAGLCPPVQFPQPKCFYRFSVPLT